MVTKVKKFEGTYHNTIFMRDHDTTGFQFAVDPSGPAPGIYDLTIAVLDSKKKRTEYVLTANRKSLQVLVDMIKAQIDPKTHA